MRFGMRLPGPFRVGVSSKGRVNVGMTMGPFSVSTGGAQRSRADDPKPVRLIGSVAQHVEQAVREGWEVTGSNARTTFLRRDGDGLRIEQVHRDYVHVSPIESRAVAVGVVLTILLPLLACAACVRWHR